MLWCLCCSLNSSKIAPLCNVSAYLYKKKTGQKQAKEKYNDYKICKILLINNVFYLHKIFLFLIAHNYNLKIWLLL